MDSILRQINQNNGNKSRKELMELYLNSIDEELNKMYQNMDCVDNYRQNYIKFRQNSRQYYQCVHNSCHFSTNKSSLIVRHIRRHLKLVSIDSHFNYILFLIQSFVSNRSPTVVQSMAVNTTSTRSVTSGVI